MNVESGADAFGVRRRSFLHTLSMPTLLHLAIGRSSLESCLFRARGSDETETDGSGGGFAAAANGEFGQNAAYMMSGRSRTDIEVGGDLGVGQALAEQPQHLPFPPRQARFGG